MNKTLVLAAVVVGLITVGCGSPPAASPKEDGVGGEAKDGCPNKRWSRSHPAPTP